MRKIVWNVKQSPSLIFTCNLSERTLFFFPSFCVKHMNLQQGKTIGKENFRNWNVNLLFFQKRFINIFWFMNRIAYKIWKDKRKTFVNKESPKCRQLQVRKNSTSFRKLKLHLCFNSFSRRLLRLDGCVSHNHYYNETIVHGKVSSRNKRVILFLKKKK